MGLTRYTRRTLVRELVLIVVGAVYCLPFYLLVAIALETTAQTYKTPLSFPWPGDYEEAALVDGACLLRSYGRVVFPLLRPITGTVAVLLGVIVWNEFFIALIFLSGSRYQTLPVALYSYAGEYVTRWNLIYAGVAISIAPILAFYLFAQRHLIRGFSAGV